MTRPADIPAWAWEKGLKFAHKISGLVKPIGGGFAIFKPEYFTVAEAHARALMEAGPEWQPIETAPCDTAILIYACGVEVAHFNTINNRWWTVSDGERTAGERNLNGWNKPTHWQHLPTPPETPND